MMHQNHPISWVIVNLLIMLPIKITPNTHQEFYKWNNDMPKENFELSGQRQKYYDVHLIVFNLSNQNPNHQTESQPKPLFRQKNG